MLKYCLDKWNANKAVLVYKLRTDTTLNTCEYVDLVKLVVDLVLNTGEPSHSSWDSGNITVVDNGDYQGTLLFLIPMKCYQPSEYEYLMTYAGYGSCSGCDTLQAIQEWDDNALLTETQVKDYMALCKDLLTNMVKPYNCGWRKDDMFAEVSWEAEVEKCHG